MTVGEAYIDTITSRASDRLARAAYCNLVMATATPNNVIFDFGAGPGIDAKVYAEHGYRVLAYDADPHMCATFLEYCRDSIASQNVTAYEGPYQSFLDSCAAFQSCQAIDLITANFAPLSLIDDPSTLFRTFHRITNPNGKIILSVLNPCYVGDMRYGWWWKNLIGFVRRGGYAVGGGAVPIYRRSPKTYSTAAAPYFKLTQVIRGMPSGALSRGLLRIPALATSRYIFLLFEKCT